MIKDELDVLKDLLGEDYCENVPMKRHTTFRTGGNADVFICPQTVEDLRRSIEILSGSDYPYYIVGNGSNIIVPDNGIRGVVISTKGLRMSKRDGNKVTFGAGVLNAEAARFAENASLGGMEFLSGIPGTIGGAAVMNAGAYGHETKDIITKATYITSSGKIKEISVSDMDYGYRHSFFSGKEFTVASCEFELFVKDKEEINAYTKDLNQRRRDKQPLNFPSAGSVFKRPEGYFAGKLIEDSGLKGFRIGGAMVSEKHAGFIINYKNATSEDILNLIEHVRNTVYDKSGVMLETEIKVLGR